MLVRQVYYVHLSGISSTQVVPGTLLLANVNRAGEKPLVETVYITVYMCRISSDINQRGKREQYKTSNYKGPRVGKKMQRKRTYLL